MTLMVKCLGQVRRPAVKNIAEKVGLLDIE